MVLPTYHDYNVSIIYTFSVSFEWYTICRPI